jgi:hypothetical protein
MDVQLKVNMILPGGRFVPYGTVIDREEIPPGIRKERYYGAPGEVEPLYLSEAESGGGDGGESKPVEGEHDPPSPPPARQSSSLRRGGDA